MTQGQTPEVILCDTTFVSLQEASQRKPETTAHWSHAVLTRIDGAIQAVSVFTLAEIRAGRIAASWGQRRSERQERLLAPTRATACSLLRPVGTLTTGVECSHEGNYSFVPIREPLG